MRHIGESYSAWSCSGTSRWHKVLCSWRIISFMSASRFRMTVCFAFCCAILVWALAWQAPVTHPVRRIYVEPFATQVDSENFRDDVIAELRRLHSVLIVPDEPSADAILGGAGRGVDQSVPQSQPAVGGRHRRTGLRSIPAHDRNVRVLSPIEMSVYRREAVCKEELCVCPESRLYGQVTTDDHKLPKLRVCSSSD